MLLLNKINIEKIFTMKDAIEANKEAYKIFSKGRSITPLRTQIHSQDNNGTMLFMPGLIEDLECAGLKIVSVFPDNIKKNKPVIPASVLLMDATTGEVISILDGTYVTQLRTGAASGAAIDILANKDAKIGALFGTGGQAQKQIEAMIVARDLEEIRVYSRKKDQRESFVSRMNEIYSDYNTKIIAANTSDEAISEADIIVTATTSTNPVFNGDFVKKGALISAVGSYQPSMQEIDPSIFKEDIKIYFDSKDAVLKESGDFIKPLEENIINEKLFNGELGEVILGEVVGRESEDEIIVFKSVGIGVQDIVTAKRIYDKAIDKNIGLIWE